MFGYAPEVFPAVPQQVRTGSQVTARQPACKAIAKGFYQPTGRAAAVFPPEPPVARPGLAERPAAGKGAPDLGAASRTLAGEDRSAIWTLTGGAGGETAFPAGELTAPAGPWSRVALLVA